jgi:RNA polymerase sigma factor (TIGR02999 family)
MGDVTRILHRIENSYPHATEELFQLVYSELRRLAAGKLASERPDHTLTATALVHEVYLRMFDEDEVDSWKSREHFFSAAAEAMRRILIESYRRKSAAKRGGDSKTIQLPDVDVPWAEHHEQMLAINDLLDQFGEDYPRQTQVFKLRCFCGMTGVEVARLLQISRRTETDDWAFAKAWLGHRIAEDDS